MISPDYRVEAEKISLSEKSKNLRLRLLEVTKNAGRGHIGPALSIIEIVDVIYRQVFNLRSIKEMLPNRDRFLLSKGHGCLALYIVLEDLQLIDALKLDDFCSYDSAFGGHPENATSPIIEFSTGSLGHGLSVGVGMAKAAKLRNEKWRVFVLVGDGELNEGSVWEAASHAKKHNLDNLVVIVDFNGMQASGLVENILDMNPLRAKWEAFGFDVTEVNGHDSERLKVVFDTQHQDKKPKCVIAYTVKGKGIKQAENSTNWHHKAKISTDEIDSLKSDLLK